MKILVTGGAGFIASQITDAYINAGHQVVVIDNLSTGRKENLNPDAKFYSLDINSDEIEQIFKTEQPEIVNHHAAQINVRTSVSNPKLDATINILGTINLLEAAKKSGSVKKFIFASSGGAIYGDADTVPTSETYWPNPISPYGIAKYTVEHYLYYYHQIYQLPYTALRYGNVYGPRQNPHGEAGVVSIFYQKARDHQPFAINGAGDQTRDFVFVADVVAANLAATTTDITGVFNVGTGIETSVTQLVDNMLTTLDQPFTVDHAPAKAGEQLRSCLDFSKAKSQLNWQPQVTLAQGLERTAQFFLDK